MAYVSNSMLMRRQAKQDLDYNRSQRQWDRTAGMAKDIEDIRDRQFERQRSQAEMQAELAAQLEESRPEYQVAPIEEQAEIGYMKGRLSRANALARNQAAIEAAKAKAEAERLKQEAISGRAEGKNKAMMERGKAADRAMMERAKLQARVAAAAKQGDDKAKWKDVLDTLERERRATLALIEDFPTEEQEADLKRITELQRQASVFSHKGTMAPEDWVETYLGTGTGEAAQPMTPAMPSAPRYQGGTAKYLEATAAEEQLKAQQQAYKAKQNALVEFGRIANRPDVARRATIAAKGGIAPPPLVEFSQQLRRKVIAYHLWGEPQFKLTADRSPVVTKASQAEIGVMIRDVIENIDEVADLPGIDPARMSSEIGMELPEDAIGRKVKAKIGG
jgi:hypothetical protein